MCVVHLTRGARCSALALQQGRRGHSVLGESRNGPRALIGQHDRERSAPLSVAMDACNASFGRVFLVPARAGLTEKST